jgi:hypothetical protein
MVCLWVVLFVLSLVAIAALEAEWERRWPGWP